MRRRKEEKESPLFFAVFIPALIVSLLVVISAADKAHEAQAATMKRIEVVEETETETEGIVGAIDGTINHVVVEDCVDWASETFPETEPEIITDTEEWMSLGRFKLTYYCPCRKCNGKWAGKATASGEPLKPGTTIAVDPKVIPLGTRVRIGEHEFIAQDTGSGIKGNRIDICLEDHSECLRAGVQYSEVHVRR